MLVDPDDWRPHGVDDLEPRAWEALRETTQSVCVTAGAGAGKTEFLAQKATYLLQTGICPSPKRILAISFKKDAARNLTERVEKRCPSEQARRFHSFTFDAFTKHLLDHFMATIPAPYRPTSNYRIAFPNRHVFDDFLARFGRRDVRADRFERAIARTPLPVEGQDLSERRRDLLSAYWDENLSREHGANLSFAMINRLVDYMLRSNAYVKAALQRTYPVVFLDEFQDTTYPQYDLLVNAFEGSRAVFTAVGDKKQRIMGWAGALPDAFEDFTNDFRAREITLLCNWRSHEGLVSIQRSLAREIDPDVEDVEAQGAQTIDGDVAAVWRFSSRDDESETIAQWIRSEVDAGRIAPHDVAILVRMRANMVEEELAPAFTREGLSLRNVARMVGEIGIQDVLAEDLTEVCLPLLKLATSSRNPVAWRKASDKMAFVYGLEPSDESAQEWLQVRIEAFVRELRDSVDDGPPDEDAAERVFERTMDFAGRERLQQAFPAYRRDADFARVEDGFRKLLRECARDAGTWGEVTERFEGVDQVPLMTVHKSKGLEFHTMIFFGLDDRTWWSLSRDNVEEISSFFVTFTRAEQRAFFSYCSERGDAFDWLESILLSAGVRTLDGNRVVSAGD